MLNSSGEVWKGPSRAELLAKAEKKQEEYLADLERQIRVARARADMNYEYALELAQTAIRHAAEVANCDAIRDGMSDAELEAA